MIMDNNNQKKNDLFTDNNVQIFTDGDSFTMQKNKNEDKVSVSSIKPSSIKSSNNLQENNQVNYHDNNIVRNKVTIGGTDFDDGIDTIIEDKPRIIEILTNKKVLLTVSVLIFVAVCVVVGKAFYFGNKARKYDEIVVKIDKKEEEFMRVYAPDAIDNEVLKKVAASELVNCINEKVDVKNLPNSVNDVIKEINNFYNQSYDYFAFAYKDIYTGFTVSYNEKQNIFTASTIKGPTDIYIYEMASSGKINLDDKLTYTAGYYNTGSGILKSRQFGTNYDTKTLLEYSTVYSDNAAHNMLMDKYGRENMLNFWKEKGTTAIFTQYGNWGVTNAHDALIYMNELYQFYVKDDVYGEALMTNFMHAVPKFLVGKNNYQVANKSGWSGSAIHDVSIVFADNPYIVVALSNLGETDYYNYYFNKANDFAYRLHTEYWKYKMSVCNDIKQY